jgi:4-carboxymuconolactone decarboxylase
MVSAMSVFPFCRLRPRYGGRRAAFRSCAPVGKDRGMARIPYPDPASLQPDTQEFLGKLGDPLNIFRMLAGGEGLLRAFSRFGNHLLFKSQLDPVLREIAILRVGVLSDATYEMYQHDRISRSIGMSEELLAGIRAGADDAVFDERQAQVMRYTDDVVRNVRASDATFDPLRDALSVQELQELTVTIGFYMCVSRFLETFGVDIEDGHRSLDVGAS